MQFIERVRGLWTWLPAFRAVAETQHLPSAARALDVVPSSLSRSIKLLEENIGAPLFDHGGKTLVLNEAGRRLLDAVRLAMREIDEAVLYARGDTVSGLLTAAVTSDVSPALLASACAAMQAQHPRLQIAVRVVNDGEVSGLLLRGELDIAVVSRLPLDHRVAITELATCPRSAFRRRGAHGDVFECVVVGSPPQPLDDGWPGERPRVIRFWASDERIAREVASSTDCVLVAADRAMTGDDRFERIADLAVRTQTLYAAHRAPMGPQPRIAALLGALRAGLG